MLLCLEAGAEGRSRAQGLKAHAWGEESRGWGEEVCNMVFRRLQAAAQGAL